MDNKKHTIQLELDLHNKTMIGKCVTEGGDDNGDEIARRVFDSVKSFFSEVPKEFIVKFNQLVDCGNVEEAFLLLKDSIHLLQFFSAKDYAVIKLFSKSLEDEKLKDICIYLVALSSKLNLVEDLSEDIDTCFRLKDDSMEESEEMSLYIEKSRVLYEKGLFNASFITLQSVVNKTKINSILGYAFKNLARLSEHNDSFEEYISKAIDHFLISGLKHDAINMIMWKLERVQGKDYNESLSLINKAIELQSSENYLDKNKSASLYQRKSSILVSLNRFEDAKEPAITACTLRRGLMGNELELHASLIMLENIYLKLNDHLSALKIKEEYEVLESNINDEDFSVAKNISVFLRDSDNVPKGQMGISISKDAPLNIKLGYVMAKYLKEDLTFAEKIELLDEALSVSREMKDHFITSQIFQQMGEQYYNNGYVSVAIDKFLESFNCDNNNKESFQNLVVLLLQEKRLNEASTLLKKRVEELGYLPNLTYIYAKNEFDLGNFKEAFKLFKIIKNGSSSDSYENLSEYISNCIEKIDDLASEPKLVTQSNVADITLEDISKALDDFAVSVSNHSRMQYWNKDDNGYKWASKPETIAKHALIMFFAARFESVNLELIQEPRAGAGFIDLYLVTNNGIKVVIELKMCGNGYSSSYALSGESQILHYLENKKTNVGFLVVFDSRTRDFAKGLQDFKSIDRYSIFTKVIDVRSAIQK